MPNSDAEEVATNGHGKENGSSSLKVLQKELEIVKEDRAALQAELQEAEQWAEGMQTEWDAKERTWKEAEEELLSRVEAAEEKAKAAEKRAKEVKAADDKPAEAAPNAWGKSGVSGAAKAEVVEAKLKEMEIKKIAAEAELKKAGGRVAELEAALKKASDDKSANENGGRDADNEGAKAVAKIETQRDLLEKRARGAEASVEAERKRADEAEKRAKEAVAKAEAAAAKKVEDLREKAERCTELERSYEKAQRELEGLRAQVNGKQGSDTPAPKAVVEEANGKEKPQQAQNAKAPAKAAKPPKAATAPEVVPVADEPPPPPARPKQEPVVAEPAPASKQKNGAQTAPAPAKKQPSPAPAAPAKEEEKVVGSERTQKPGRAPAAAKTAQLAVSKAFGALDDGEDAEEDHEEEETTASQKVAKAKVPPTASGKGSAKTKGGAGTETKVAKSTKSGASFSLKGEHLAGAALILAALFQVMSMFRDGLLG